MRVKRLAKVLLKTVKWFFIVFIVYLGSLAFREETIPARWVERAVQGMLPTNFVFHVEAMSFGFRRGLDVRGLKLYDLAKNDPLTPMVAAKELEINFLQRRVRAVALQYPYLPDSYYAPGNLEKNAPVEVELPVVPRFSLELVRPDILGVRPTLVTAEVKVDRQLFSVDRIQLDWPDQEERMILNGFCYVDLVRQEIYGEVDGSAKQCHIRPMLERLDVPTSLPYVDNFTEVPGKVPSWCGWKVNLINNDFDLYLKLNPTMGKYCTVPMKRADGNIHLHIYTRGTSLDYRQTIGPIYAVGVKNEPLSGTVVVTGTNGYNVVDIEAKSALPVASLLKIGGFTGDYVGDDVVGESACQLQFRFPRSMTNNYEVLNGSGHVEIANGQVMRMRGFKGLLELLADRVPGVSWLTDSTQASCDYRIENGVIKTDNIYIEGTVFSIKMYGQFDAVKDELDFTVRVQFTKKDSLAGKILHPLTWPFTKLLLEFKLSGTSDNPKWKYISVLDRVLEVTK